MGSQGKQLNHKKHKRHKKAPVLPNPVFAPLVAVQSQSRPAPRIACLLSHPSIPACGMSQKAPCFLTFDEHRCTGCTGFFQETTGLYSLASAIPHQIIAGVSFPCSSVSSCLSCSSCSSMFVFYWHGPDAGALTYKGPPESASVESAPSRKSFIIHHSSFIIWQVGERPDGRPRAISR